MTSVRSIRVQCCVHAEHHYDIQQCNDITAKIEELSHIAATLSKRLKQKQEHHHERRDRATAARARHSAHHNSALFGYSTILFVAFIALLLCITSSLELI